MITLLFYLLQAVFDLLNLFVLNDRFFLNKRTNVGREIVLIGIYEAIAAYSTVIILPKVNSLYVVIVFSFIIKIKELPILYHYYDNQKFILANFILYRCIAELLSRNIEFLLHVTLPIQISGISLKASLSGFSSAFLIFFILLLMIVFNRTRQLPVYFNHLPYRNYSLFSAVLILLNCGIWLLTQNTINYKITFGLQTICIILEFIFLLLIFDALSLNNRKILSQRENDLLDQQIQSMISYYKDLNAKDENLRALRHDIKNHLLVLNELLETGKIETAINYISQLQAIHEETQYVFQTGNIIADSLLTSKSAFAVSFNTSISFSGRMPSDHIKETDFCIILANLADNALEACEKQDGEKNIHILSVVKNKLWTLKISNPIDEKIINPKTFLKTSKHDKVNHGLGLENIARTIQKYNGTMNIDTENNTFTVTITLNLKSSC